MPQNDDKPKMAHEQVIGVLHGAAEQAINLFAEPDVVVSVVLWDRKLDELPCLVITGRTNVTPEQLVQLGIRLAKASAEVLSRASSMLSRQERRARETDRVPRSEGGRG